MADNNQADNTLTGLGIFTAIANAQAQRNIVDNSIASYLGYMRTVTRILCQYEELRLATLEHEQGFPLQHTGEAKGIFRIKFPMKPEHVSILFAMISVVPFLFLSFPFLFLFFPFSFLSFFFPFLFLFFSFFFFFPYLKGEELSVGDPVMVPFVP